MKRCLLLLVFESLFFLSLFAQSHTNSAIYGKRRKDAKAATPVAQAVKGLDLVDFLPPATATYIEYEIGQGVMPYTAKRYLTPYALSRTETTYELWYETLVWAKAHGYSFASEGQAGSEGKRGKAPTEENKLQPVTNISWYDAIVWCNALSEKSALEPCYKYKNTVLKDSRDSAFCDLAVCDWNSSGYRLPTEAEWEYAARKSGNKMQDGSLASGESVSVSQDEVAWTSSNAKSTMDVATAKANGSGLFDMSGNVLEFCWDWFADYGQGAKERRSCGPKFGSERVSRGGAWSDYTPVYGAGDRYSYDPNEAYNYMGFRIAVSR